jgi:hypothetical protein
LDVPAIDQLALLTDLLHRRLTLGVRHRRNGEAGGARRNGGTRERKQVRLCCHDSQPPLRIKRAEIPWSGLRAGAD